MKIYAINNGHISAHIKDPNFSHHLPIIPSEVNMVNFTWESGKKKKYYYNFDRLLSIDESILKPPTISINTTGRIPQKPKGKTTKLIDFKPQFGGQLLNHLIDFSMAIRVQYLDAMYGQRVWHRNDQYWTLDKQSKR